MDGWNDTWPRSHGRAGGKHTRANQGKKEGCLDMVAVTAVAVTVLGYLMKKAAK